jgi:hypothetical protein
VLPTLPPGETRYQVKRDALSNCRRQRGEGLAQGTQELEQEEAVKLLLQGVAKSIILHVVIVPTKLVVKIIFLQNLN